MCFVYNSIFDNQLPIPEVKAIFNMRDVLDLPKVPKKEPMYFFNDHTNNPNPDN